MNLPEDQDRELRNREFVRLLGEHELRLAGYIHTLVPVWHDAQDVLQRDKTSVVGTVPCVPTRYGLCRLGIYDCRLLVRAHRKRCQRGECASATTCWKNYRNRFPSFLWWEEDRVLALVECVKALDAVAASCCVSSARGTRRSKTSPATWANALGYLSGPLRIRRLLFKCVEKRLQEENRR